MTYLESDHSSTTQGSFSMESASMTAVSSMRLLVVSGAPPESSFLWAPYSQDGAPAAGPGIAGAGAVGIDGDLFHRFPFPFYQFQPPRRGAQKIVKILIGRASDTPGGAMEHRHDRCAESHIRQSRGEETPCNPEHTLHHTTSQMVFYHCVSLFANY